MQVQPNGFVDGVRAAIIDGRPARRMFEIAESEGITDKESRDAVCSTYRQQHPGCAVKLSQSQASAAGFYIFDSEMPAFISALNDVSWRESAIVDGIRKASFSRGVKFRDAQVVEELKELTYEITYNGQTIPIAVGEGDKVKAIMGEVARREQGLNWQIQSQKGTIEALEQEVELLRQRLLAPSAPSTQAKPRYRVKAGSSRIPSQTIIVSPVLASQHQGSRASRDKHEEKNSSRRYRRMKRRGVGPGGFEYATRDELAAMSPEERQNYRRRYHQHYRNAQSIEFSGARA